MAGRPKGTKDPNARRERLSIPLTAAEKLLLENTARLIAKQRGEPDLGVATIMRGFLLSEMVNFYKSLLPEDHQNMEVQFMQVFTGKAGK